MQIKKFIYTCNQINQQLCAFINEKKKLLMITKNKSEKIKRQM